MWLKRLLKLEKDTAGQAIRAQVSWGYCGSYEAIERATASEMQQLNKWANPIVDFSF